MSKDQMYEAKRILKHLVGKVIYNLKSRRNKGIWAIYFTIPEYDKTFSNGFERITPNRHFSLNTISDVRKFAEYEYKLY